MSVRKSVKEITKMKCKKEEEEKLYIHETTKPLKLWG